MKYLILVILTLANVVWLGYQISGADHTNTSRKSELKERIAAKTAERTNVFDAELVPPNTNAPIVLQSGSNSIPTNVVEELKKMEEQRAMERAKRLPVYVLPEIIQVTLPDGTRLMWIEKHHLQELANKFRAIRYTNIIIYADGV